MNLPFILPKLPAVEGRSVTQYQYYGFSVEHSPYNGEWALIVDTSNSVIEYHPVSLKLFESQAKHILGENFPDLSKFVTAHICANCGEAWREGETLDIKDFEQRVGSGDTDVPISECPNCVALCYERKVDEGLALWGRV